MEEQKDLGGIGVAFGKGEEVEIVVSYVEVLEDDQVGGTGPWERQCVR